MKRANGSGQDLRVQLVHALQKARGELAVAAAAETKATPAARWIYYRETDEELRRCLRDLRRDVAPVVEKGRFVAALGALRGAPASPGLAIERPGKALQICRHLREVLRLLELDLSGEHSDHRGSMP